MPDNTAPHPALDRAAKLFQLLADPSRLRMLYLLLERGELHVNAVCGELGLHQSGVSNHLSLLRRAGAVAPRRDGQRTFYRVESDLVVALLRRAAGEWDAGEEEE
jgi:ArsR family transcriptional regulator